VFDLVSNPVTLTAIATALAATLISPFVSIYVARRQIRATLVSANRQAWINALRDDLSEVFEILTDVRPARLSEEEKIKYADKLSRARLLITRIRLRLNPQEEPSKALDALIVHLFEISLPMEFNDELGRAISKSQEILKAEWRRVKAGR
jgi:hypothetical protein